MKKAYDTFLLAEVSAYLAAQAGSFEPYRYECAHCGEEVRLFAVDSISMIPHFRHLSGNSNIECEYYLGQYGTFSTDARSRKSKSERVEFYFDSNTEMFYLGLRFSEDEIYAYEQLSTIFELRATAQSQPFYSLCISNRNFSSDEQRLIPLEKFSHSYFSSNTLNGIKRKYDVFNTTQDNSATFFKLQVGDSGNRAKLVRSSILYTNIPYFIAIPSQSQYSLLVDTSFPSEITVDSTFKFETMGRKFLGKFITITSKTANIDSLLSSWGYQLESSEILTLLWPPAVISEDVSLINSEAAYLYSTFELQAHGNMNVLSKDITKIADGLTMVAVKPSVKVYKKNAELMIETFEQKSHVYAERPVMRRSKSEFQITESASFIFNRYGVRPLGKGAIAQLTPNSEVRSYSSGYLHEIVSLPEPSTISRLRLLQDVLMYYKKNEPLNMSDFKLSVLSKTAIQYIEDCQKEGLINSAANLLIKGGRI